MQPCLESSKIAIVSVCPIGCIALFCVLSLKDAMLCEVLNVWRQRCCIIRLARSKRTSRLSVCTNAFADHHASDRLSRSAMLRNRRIADPHEVSAQLASASLERGLGALWYVRRRSWGRCAASRRAPGSRLATRRLPSTGANVGQPVNPAQQLSQPIRLILTLSRQYVPLHR